MITRIGRIISLFNRPACSSEMAGPGYLSDLRTSVWTLSFCHGLALICADVSLHKNRRPPHGRAACWLSSRASHSAHGPWGQPSPHGRMRSPTGNARAAPSAPRSTGPWTHLHPLAPFARTGVCASAGVSGVFISVCLPYV